METERKAPGLELGRRNPPGLLHLVPFCRRWPHPIPDLQRCKLFVYKRERRLATVLMGGGHIVSCDYWKPYPTAKTPRSFYCGYTKSSNNSTLFCDFCCCCCCWLWGLCMFCFRAVFQDAFSPFYTFLVWLAQQYSTLLPIGTDWYRVKGE